MINRNRFLKVFSLTMAAMALTVANNAKAADPTLAADTLESAGNVSDSLNISASIASRLAINLLQDDIAAAPGGVTRSEGADSVTFSHADSAKKALPSTEISSIHLVSNDNEGFEVRACSDYGGRLLAAVAGGVTGDAQQEVQYSLSVSSVEGQSVAEGSLGVCGSAGVVDSAADAMLIDGTGIAYENSLVALDAGGLEALSPARMLSIAWSEDTSRVADSYEDNLHVKIFGVVPTP